MPVNYRNVKQAPVRKVFFIPRISASFPPIRTNAAIIKALSAIAAYTPETVVCKSVTSAEMDIHDGVIQNHHKRSQSHHHN
jgi:pyridoxal/pyridoxine/pyridoxamine kinase